MRFKKLWGILCLVLVCWLILAQCSMQMRTSDATAHKEFAEKGVPIALSDRLFGGHKLHIAVTGIDTVATLFFIHGSPGSWDAFEEYLKDKDLRSKYRLISIDRPGFGHSEYGRGISLTEQSGLIGSLIISLQNGKPFYIIGHSLGGPMCVKLAAHYPRYINGVVLLAASVDPGEEKRERWRPVLQIPPFRWLLPGAFRPSNDELWYFKQDVTSMPADLHAITCPVVIMQGLMDSMVPPGNAYYAQKQLVNSPQVQLITIPDANHFIPWTRFAMIKKVLMGADTTFQIHPDR